MKRNLRNPIVCACLWMAMLQSTSPADAQAETATPSESRAASDAEGPAAEESESETKTDSEESAPDTNAQEQATNERTQSPTPRVAIVRHAPLNDSFVEDVSFMFDINSPDYAGKVVVRVIPDEPDQAAHEVEAVLTGTKYVAVLPQAHVAPPGFWYYVVERMPDGSERPVFADATAPHRVRVTRTEAEETQERRARARDGIRSTVLLSAEAVDYGDRKLGADQPRFHDRYYKLEVGYAFAFFSTIEDVRISLVRVRGQAAVYDPWEEPRIKEVALGIDYGRAAVTLVAHDYVRLRGAMLLGASQRGFEYGGAGSIVIGNPLGSNLDFGVEALTTLGTVTHLRLGFLATQQIPMGAALEVSSFPVGEDSGVRLLYDIGYRFNPVTEILLRAGYQARTSVTGGASLGLTVNYGF